MAKNKYPDGWTESKCWQCKHFRYWLMVEGYEDDPRCWNWHCHALALEVNRPDTLWGLGADQPLSADKDCSKFEAE